jgi:hypothetical protein
MPAIPYNIITPPGEVRVCAPAGKYERKRADLLAIPAVQAVGGALQKGGARP